MKLSQRPANGNQEVVAGADNGEVVTGHVDTGGSCGYARYPHWRCRLSRTLGSYAAGDYADVARGGNGEADPSMARLLPATRNMLEREGCRC